MVSFPLGALPLPPPLFPIQIFLCMIIVNLIKIRCLLILVCHFLSNCKGGVINIVTAIIAFILSPS